MACDSPRGVLPDRSQWETMTEWVHAPELPDTLVGFNVNLDRVIAVDETLLNSPTLNAPEMGEVKRRLLESMRTCTADEWFVPDPALYSRLHAQFEGTGSLTIGGQAGVAAVHLAKIGVRYVTCIAPSIGLRTRKILQKDPRIHLPLQTQPDTPDTIHLVFEYEPGVIPVNPGTVPRGNRFIVSPVHDASTVLIPQNVHQNLYSKAGSCARAFLSGFQYLHSEDEFAAASAMMTLLKNKSSEMKIHVEMVTVSDPQVLCGILAKIFPCAQSAGMNEHELRLLDAQDSAESGTLSTPADLAGAAVRLCEANGLLRLHLHTYGYYLLVRRVDDCDPTKSLSSLLFTSRTLAVASGGDRFEILPEGLTAVEQIAGEYDRGPAPGTFTNGRYFIIAVPSLIARNAVRTVGFGDMISSTAFVSDHWR